MPRRVRRPSPSTSPDRPELRASPPRAPQEPVFIPGPDEVREVPFAADSEGEDIRAILEEAEAQGSGGEEAREGGANDSFDQGEEAREGGANDLSNTTKAMKPDRAAPRVRVRIRRSTLRRLQQTLSLK